MNQRESPAPPGTVSMNEVVRRNIASVVELEQELHRQRSPVDRVSDRITRFSGSLQFILAHVVIFALWILLNGPLVLGGRAFDPYPFNFLGLVVALEAILLSTFVLMSQNHLNRQADRWAHLDLQISLLAEQETTKMLQLLQKVCTYLGMDKAARDTELKALAGQTKIETVVEELDKAREHVETVVEELEKAEEAHEQVAAP